ncbi:hypothetical protein RHGRI_005588 [Rhododendron griersonianum]|uniref:Uncharacterized protein n=1 Tax=Rhododendron griersonianum TaxID=479676 RepID=A0AAV6LFQ5_9ERIC|nr:hypothetical protein RHGRI_005588 [Rhododendron griersonianum]
MPMKRHMSQGKTHKGNPELQQRFNSLELLLLKEIMPRSFGGGRGVSTSAYSGSNLTLNVVFFIFTGTKDTATLIGPSISSIRDLLLKGAANLIWAWEKKFKEGAKELSRTLVGLDNKENMEAVRAMRIDMATMHAMVKAINRMVDLLLAGPTHPMRPTLPLPPLPPLSPKENGEAVGEVNGESDSEVKVRVTVK